MNQENTFLSSQFAIQPKKVIKKFRSKKLIFLISLNIPVGNHAHLPTCPLSDPPTQTPVVWSPETIKGYNQLTRMIKIEYEDCISFTNFSEVKVRKSRKQIIISSNKQMKYC